MSPRSSVRSRPPGPAAFAVLASLVVTACETPMGEGVWAVHVDGVVTAAGEPVAGAEVRGFTWDSAGRDEHFDWPEDADTTDAAGRYALDLGVFGGGSGCDTSWAHLQVVRVQGESADTTRPAPVRVRRCIDRRSQETIDIALD